MKPIYAEKWRCHEETLSEAKEKVFGGVEYECVRCGTRVTSEELTQLPEVKCLCGYRVLRKARPAIVKQIRST